MIKKSISLIAILLISLMFSLNSFAQEGTEKQTNNKNKIENIKMLMSAEKINEFMIHTGKPEKDEEVYNSLLKLHEEYYTDDEVKLLLDFLNSDVGIKFMNFTQKIQAEIQKQLTQ